MNPETPKSKQDTDKEVLLILNEIQANAAIRKTAPIAETPDPLIVAESVVRLTASGKETLAPLVAPKREAHSKEESSLEEPPAKRPNFFVRLWRSLIPVRGDGPLEFLRKCLFMLAFLTLISSASYLFHDQVWVPVRNEAMNEELQEIVHRYDNPTPEQHREMMQELYAINPDFRAWLTYKSTGSDFLQIDYPVVYKGDNDYYLERDFYQSYNKNGTLFFDMNNQYTISTPIKNRISIIYGHNMISGQMFAQLNQMLGNISNVKAAPTMTLTTFHGTAEYKVFAVVLVDARASNVGRFSYLRTDFTNDIDFLDHVNALRARSLYDFEGVDVTEDDELLLLSTCTNESQSHLKDGRLAVVARKVRVGEDPRVDTTQIYRNTDVIMPRAWYTNQKLTPHAYYKGDYVIPDPNATTTTASSTAATTATTTEPAPETEDTAQHFGAATEATAVDNNFSGNEGVILPSADPSGETDATTE